MIDVMLYIGVGLMLYSYQRTNKFEFDKPMFWATLMAWPVMVIITFFQAYLDVLKEHEGKK